ncbi:MAG TPA: 23S rRNA (guanosine(2251)-2'-O)-methyltransferase RlmB [Caulobacteraceae bacterium]|nr:23S rRNA (guanosine(2251)-2'-O)-methyltransferase RlmB [Caulobacteraceae bacterium]
MTRHPRRNDGKKPPAKGWSPDVERGGHRPQRRGSSPSSDWLWGWHPVLAALSNPARGKPRRLVATAERAKELAQRFPALAAPEIADAAAIAHLLPSGASHQGVALKPEPLAALTLAELASPAAGVLVMLDQVTDPQNVGAVFRSAAAFGARGVIVQDRHAPPFTGVLAKAAAGALDAVAHARVVNLARALDDLADLGWRAVGLAGDAPETLEQVLDGRPTVLVLGSEGEGLRRLVGEHCDTLARIPMPGGFESLNVSNAAAIALYEASRPKS